jgi:hypothetical protein
MTSKCLAEVNGNNKTTSQRKVEANRRNAQLSTGPTSAEGKKTGSRNASKHGLLVKDVVITNRGNKEDPAEFDALLAEMCDFYSPLGVAEDLLVREITISYWRTARALRCERGYVTLGGETPTESELSEMEISLLPLRYPIDAYRTLLQTSRGIKFLLGKIEEMQSELQASTSASGSWPSWLCPEKDWKKIASSGKKHVLAALAKETAELIAKKSEIEENDLQWKNDRSPQKRRWTESIGMRPPTCVIAIRRRRDSINYKRGAGKTQTQIPERAVILGARAIHSFTKRKRNQVTPGTTVFAR